MRITVLVATALMVWVTIDYFRSLRHNGKTVVGKTWDWMKNLLDILWGLG
jgi:hypothetical protein